MEGDKEILVVLTTLSDQINNFFSCLQQSENFPGELFY